MKIYIRPMRAFYAITTSAIIFLSCEKGESLNAESISVETASTIAIAATDSTLAASPADSIYLLQKCEKGGRRDSIAAASIPPGIINYLTSNYEGYVVHKAFALLNRRSSLTGYVVVIYYNDKPVGLQFDNAGAFVKVLEQREKGDLSGDGHHRGGRSEHRDGNGRDSVALTAIGSMIISYISTNHPTDTLVKAFRNRDSSIVVLSKNNGAFATIFSSNGAFLKRTSLVTKTGSCQSIELSDLPSAAANHLSQTYPNYILQKAFSMSQGGVLTGFIVVIDANNTKYAVYFDMAGSYITAKTII